MPNTVGVLVLDSDDNRIGGISEDAGNLIVASGAGIQIKLSSSTRIQGNSIVGNGVGILAEDSGQVNETVIGGTEGITPAGPCTGACNVISGSVSSAIFLRNSSTVIQGNFTDIPHISP